ncbi:FMN-binding protein [Sporolactobacillus sp. KGMB 08714]|uniref:FMN-binding protein n=1 Tax=Sporolactobacillus sp. KGMB 08714 TaxID=3064704 RepID=UPI002FBE2087
MSKLSPKWITLCTAAIGLAYTAGYVVTEPKAVAVSVPQQNVQTGTGGSQSQGVQGSQGGSSSSAASDASSGQSNQNNQSSQGSSTAQSQSGYKDGTYTGQGQNRIGSVAVSVTIKQGKIANVQITDCTTSFPQSAIDPLPAQVVSRQNSNVDNVSGATESTDDFITAVQQALSQAQA